jgi:hypothetical protein
MAYLRGTLDNQTTDTSWNPNFFVDSPLGVAGQDAVTKIVRTVKQHTDISIDFTVVRKGAIGHVQVLPDIGPDGQGKIGVQLQNNATAVRKRVEGPVQLAVQSVKETVKMVRGTMLGFFDLISNLGEASQSLSGPVAVVAVGAEVARESPQGGSLLLRFSESVSFSDLAGKNMISARISLLETGNRAGDLVLLPLQNDMSSS